MQAQQKLSPAPILSSAPIEAASTSFEAGGPVAEMHNVISNRMSASMATGTWQVNHGENQIVDTIKLQKLGYAVLAGMGAGAVLFLCSLPVLL